MPSMINTLIAILFVYLFILLGYLAKHIFKEEISTKTLTLISVYFLQPFVAIWGFSSASLSVEHLYVPLISIGIILLLLIPTVRLGKRLFSHPKDRAIFTIAGFVGNTGNIGIPLGIVLFGEASVLYTTLINLGNVLFVYTLGVYFYSRGSFSVKHSLLNIIKVPIVPVSIVAMCVNLYGVEINMQIQEFFKMGAYAGIVLQLFLLGTFIQGITFKHFKPKLVFFVLSQKFIVLPLATLFLVSFTDLSTLAKGVIVMEMMVPLAIANINLASLYDCKAKEVTLLILLSTLGFVPVLFGVYGLLG